MNANQVVRSTFLGKTITVTPVVWRCGQHGMYACGPSTPKSTMRISWLVAQRVVLLHSACATGSVTWSGPSFGRHLRLIAVFAGRLEYGPEREFWREIFVCCSAHFCFPAVGELSLTCLSQVFVESSASLWTISNGDAKTVTSGVKWVTFENLICVVFRWVICRWSWQSSTTIVLVCVGKYYRLSSHWEQADYSGAGIVSFS
jgi:hypothetical protein